MFVFEWMIDWLYGEILKFFSELFGMMGNMGVEIFDLAWIQAIVLFFNWFGWSLFVIGLLVAVFDVAIAMQSGKASLKDAGLNAIKGFLAVGMFTTVPIELYKFCITLQGTLSKDIVSLFQSSTASNIPELTTSIITKFTSVASIINLFLIIALGYCVTKVFFANIKRGGILLITIAVGSLYMFSVPRGYTDGFMSWCKQVIALCITAFLQMTLLMAGLITWDTNLLMGVGVMLAAGEVPRIAGAFGLDTSAKFNVMSSYYAAQAAMNAGKSIMKVVAK